MPKVVTCLLMKDSKLLILKRSDKVSTYKGLWGGVAGYIEEHEEPYETALKEIKEEVGIEKKMSALFDSAILLFLQIITKEKSTSGQYIHFCLKSKKGTK